MYREAQRQSEIRHKDQASGVQQTPQIPTNFGRDTPPDVNFPLGRYGRCPWATSFSTFSTFSTVCLSPLFSAWFVPPEGHGRREQAFLLVRLVTHAIWRRPNVPTGKWFHNTACWL